MKVISFQKIVTQETLVRSFFSITFAVFKRNLFNSI